ncbi:hypothetical protein [Paracidovorax konjaci]|uniref:Uncharacterized protein n=1 Tax=Paracidovorax konjaci TaxID=32040 RepID=A0A1I1W463_9BURK|nr:hypothetical protein [Paracidovorax konjaci]SFD89178.1 hypothetical protein SAMN04489710_10850 [Paracidovorax konjaci]
MPSSRKIVKVLVLVSVGVVGTAALLFIGAWATFDISDVGRGSMTYRLAAPRSLKSVETIGECRPPMARWKGRDGEGVPFSSLTYGSSASTLDILRFYEAAFAKQACEVETSASGSGAAPLLGMLCRNPEFASVQVFVDKEGACRDVTVGFTEND